jgi:hypothetical protein
MNTESRSTGLDFFNGLEWPEDDPSNSNYVYNLPDDSNTSSGYESVIAEDLDLYESRCVC